MKRAGRIANSLLICLMLVNGLVIAETNEADSLDKTTIHAIELVKALGIMVGDDDSGDFRPNDPMTRGEFSVTLCRILGVDGETWQTSESSFEDVEAGTVEGNSIKFASDAGLINGVGDGRFEPENPITYEQAIKTLVVALGYDFYAQSKGGYPLGYIITAHEKGIVKNGEFNFSDVAQRKHIARLVYNTIHADLMTQVTFGDNIGRSSSDNRTLLTDKLKIEVKKGIVSANQYTRLNGTSNLGNNCVEIENAVYKCGTTQAASLLGYYVTSYVKQDDSGMDTIIYIEALEARNSVIEIESDNISSETKGLRVVYIIEGVSGSRVREVNLSRRADIIYNGKASDFNLSDVKTLDGKIRLIDNNMDGSYDVAFVNVYDIYVVDHVNTSLNVVYGKYGMGSLDLESSSSRAVNIYKDGIAIEVKDLSKWDVLTVEQSNNNGTLCNVFVASDNRITGAIDEIGDETIAVNGEVYKMTQHFKNRADVRIGRSGTVYLDISGRVVAFDESATEITTGYLLRASYEGGLSGIAHFRILDNNGKWLSYEGAEKINLNGVAVQKAKDVIDSPIFSESSVDDQGNPYKKFVHHQLIKYRLDTEDKVNEIHTKESKDEIIHPLTTGMQTFYFRRFGQRIGDYINYDLSSKVFTLPDVADMDIASEYSKTELQSFTNNTQYTFALYCTSEDSIKTNSADAIVYFRGGSGGQVEDSNRAAVVEKVVTTLDGEGDEVNGVYLWIGGVMEIYTSRGGKIINGLAPGDVIQVNTDGKRVVNYRKLFSSSIMKSIMYFDKKGYDFDSDEVRQNAFGFWNATSPTDYTGNRYIIDNSKILNSSTYSFRDIRMSENLVYCGVITERIGDYIIVESNDEDPNEKMVFNLGLIKQDSFYEFNRKSKKVTVAEKNHFTEGMFIVIKLRGLAPSDIIMYNMDN